MYHNKKINVYFLKAVRSIISTAAMLVFYDTNIVNFKVEIWKCCNKVDFTALYYVNYTSKNPSEHDLSKPNVLKTPVRWSASSIIVLTVILLRSIRI